MKAVIQAGGKGTRLRPYTLVLPKPMMPVGDMPVIELLLGWLRRNGVHEVVITTGHLGSLIQALCGNGEQWGLDISYTAEDKPMGTLGALDLLRDQLHEPFLVLNGDLLTDLDLRAFRRFHLNHSDPLTVAVKSTAVPVNMGVFEYDKKTSRIEDFREKPVFNYNFNMGIYCMDPVILERIPRGLGFGFDDLIYSMLDEGASARVFVHDGEFLDIGRPEDYRKAQDMVSEGRLPNCGD